MVLARLPALLATLLLATPVLAAAPQHANYVTLQLEAVRSTPFGTGSLPGLTIDWGFFQNRYVGGGTRLVLQRDAGDGLGSAIMLLTGPQFHVPIGEHVLLIPALNIGLRASSTNGLFTMGYAGYLEVGAAWRDEDMYVGVAGQTPLFLAAPTAELFPSIYSGSLFVGFYY